MDIYYKGGIIYYVWEKETIGVHWNGNDDSVYTIYIGVEHRKRPQATQFKRGENKQKETKRVVLKYIKKRIKKEESGMNNKRIEEKEFFEKIKRISNIDLFGVKKEIKYLRKILYKEERILVITSGMMEDGTWIAVCTNSRVIFINRGMLCGTKHSEVIIDKINSVSYKNGIINGEIYIEDGASARVIKHVPKYTTQHFVNSVHNAISLSRKEFSRKERSSADEIIKFKKLLDDGAITKEEFENQKRKLLDY